MILALVLSCVVLTHLFHKMYMVLNNDIALLLLEYQTLAQLGKQKEWVISQAKILRTSEVIAF